MADWHYISGNAERTEYNPLGLGCYLVMSGQGFDDIFGILESERKTFGTIFRRCERWFKTNFPLIRIDIAIDARNEITFSTPEHIQKKCKKRIHIHYEKAHAFAMLFNERPFELGKLTFGLLAENLRFLVQNKNKSDKSRGKTYRFWKHFLGAVEPLKQM